MGFALGKRLLFIQPFDEQQVGELLHQLKRIRNTPRPKVVPHRVDLRLQFACNHLVCSFATPAELAQYNGNRHR